MFPSRVEACSGQRSCPLLLTATGPRWLSATPRGWQMAVLRTGPPPTSVCLPAGQSQPLCTGPPRPRGFTDHHTGPGPPWGPLQEPWDGSSTVTRGAERPKQMPPPRTGSARQGLCTQENAQPAWPRFVLPLLPRGPEALQGRGPGNGNSEMSLCPRSHKHLP